MSSSRRRLDRLIFSIHLAFGVLGGAYFAVIGATGSILVFAPEISAITMPPPRPGFGGPALPLRLVIERVEARYPEWRVTRVRWFPEPGDRYRVTLARRSGTGIDMVLFVDRATGDVLGSEAGWLRWTTELHHRLLSGAAGLRINGVGAGLLGVVALTGLFVWFRWPGRTDWRRALHAVAAGSRRAPYDIHRLTGVSVCVMLLAIATSGVYFGYPEPFRRAAGWPSPPVSGAPAGTSAPADLEPMIARAKAAFPDGIVTAYYPPAEPRAPLRFRVKRLEDSWEFGRSEVYLDRYSGEVLARVDAVEASPGQRIGVLWMALVHYGRFGGLPTRVLWVLLGMTPGLLFVTGLVMWWKRSLRAVLRRPAADDSKSGAR